MARGLTISGSKSKDEAMKSRQGFNETYQAAIGVSVTTHSLPGSGCAVNGGLIVFKENVHVEIARL